MPKERIKREPWQKRWYREISAATMREIRGELTGCRRLLVQGCDRILDFNERSIRLCVRDADIHEMVVVGEALRCVSYHPDAIVITGRIGRIELGEREGARED